MQGEAQGKRKKWGGCRHFGGGRFAGLNSMKKRPLLPDPGRSDKRTKGRNAIEGGIAIENRLTRPRKGYGITEKESIHKRVSTTSKKLS